MSAFRDLARRGMGCQGQTAKGAHKRTHALTLVEAHLLYWKLGGEQFHKI